MAQINPTVGDLEGNIEKIMSYIKEAKGQKADLVIFPEQVVSGYPPQDLLYEKDFIRKNKEMLWAAMKNNTNIISIVGFVDYDKTSLYNAAAIFEANELAGVVYKVLLPTYDVFDEDRYFTPAKEQDIAPVKVNIKNREVKIGVEICEDLWDHDYDLKVTDLLKKRGADLIVNLSSSPFHIGKRFEREELIKEKAIKNQLPFFYVNLVGGQDELIFDGQSLAVDSAGNFIAFGKQFEEDLLIIDLDLPKGTAPKIEIPAYNMEEEMFNGLVLGLRDYFWKTGFKKAILGMSGGIDSSLTACIAVEALNKENVIGVSMPSKFSSDHSKTDAKNLARNLEIEFIQFSIQEIVNSYHRVLKTPLEEVRKHFSINKDKDDPVADENIQPRVRGNCLMDFSNRLKDLGILVLNTGNKTELALGYTTLYGDLSGGISVIGDVSKIEVYKLAEYVNKKAGKEVIPQNVLMKKPSAELKEDQFDPFDFDVVSPLVDEIVENHRSKRELIELGYPEEMVDDCYKRFVRSEYKRRQAPPCLKITKKAFGVGWKMPIVNKYA
ncbi:MAG: NAD+ synthase [Candidatus Hermodarchaeota archaeon]